MPAKYNPVQNFIKSSSSGSFILLGCTVLALILANSPWSHQYHQILKETLSVGFTDAGFAISKPVHLWINDGLMTIFFFYVGLEIKREILAGELTTLNKASMPIFAALGGIAIPIALFFVLNRTEAGSAGWGIPMATDIAFSLGILSILGNRVPMSLKVFLTAFAIIDDMGAILVIALFYAENIELSYLFWGGGIVVFFAILTRLGFYSKYLFILGAFVVWVFFLKSGIHPTISGVLMALVIPASRITKPENFVSKTQKTSEIIDETDVEDIVLSDKQAKAVQQTTELSERIQSPLERIEHGLSGWVSIVIMPIFALANAGITINLNNLGESYLITQIAISMVVGKVLGIFLFSFLAYKLGIAVLPKGMDFKQLLGISFLGGVGFTMALFIGGLAFSDESLLIPSKMGILIGSLVAGVTGYLLLRYFLGKTNSREKSA